MTEPTDANLTDADLTEHGLAPTDAQARVLILACGALAREILSLTRQWDHVAVTCLPAILHNHPERILPAVKAAIAQHQDSYDRIFVAYADCGTGGALQIYCDDMGIEMIAGPHCYSFYEGNDAFAERDEITAFYLTDFLARQFDAFVWRPLGLDRHPELRDMYFGNYEKLVYQSQTSDPALLAAAQDAATRLGLRFEHRPTGLGDLATALTRAARTG